MLSLTPGTGQQNGGKVDTLTIRCNKLNASDREIHRSRYVPDQPVPYDDNCQTDKLEQYQLMLRNTRLTEVVLTDLDFAKSPTSRRVYPTVIG